MLAIGEFGHRLGNLRQLTTEVTSCSPTRFENALQSFQVTKSFDVFLSHNSKCKPAVRELAEALRARKLNVWLDEWELVPGRPWQEALEEIIETTQSAAVLVGRDGLGPWQDEEMRACLAEFVRRKVAVIPVLLPGAPEVPRLPFFLKRFTWVDLREGLTEEGIDRLHWGVTGTRPDSSKPSSAAPIREVRGAVPSPLHGEKNLPLSPPAARRSRLRRLVAFCARAMGVLAVFFLLMILLAFIFSKVVKHDRTPIEEPTSIANDVQTATDPAQPLLAEARSWPIAFADHFNSARDFGRAWGTAKDDGDGTSSSLVSSGLLRLSLATSARTGELTQDWATSATAGGDFYLRADMRKIRGSEAASGGIVFRGSNNDTEFYAFQASEVAYWIGIYKDSSRELRPWTHSSAIRPHRINSLAVLAHGTTMIFFINNHKIDQISDSTLRSGHAGVAVAAGASDAAHYEFSTFELRLPSAAVHVPRTDAMSTDNRANFWERLESALSSEFQAAPAPTGSPSTDLSTGADTPKDPPSWLAYPKATMEAGFLSTTAKATSQVFGFSTTDSLDRVLTFYQDQLRNNGLTVLPPTTLGARNQTTIVTLIADSTDKKLHVQVVVQHDAGKTRASISYEDRH